MENLLFMTPGPTMLDNSVMTKIIKERLYHRSEDFSKIYRSLKEKLKMIFQTNGEIILLASSGTGALEASILNVFSPGDKVLVVDNGKFSKRLGDMADSYGLEVIKLEYNWGEQGNINKIKSIIEKENINGLMLTHHETSTGVINNLKGIGKLLEGKNIIFMVDTISGILANKFSMNECNIDIAIASSQKAFMLPTGLSFVALSERAITRSKNSKFPKYYFDFNKYIGTDTPPFTPVVELIMACDILCEDILKISIDEFIMETKEKRIFLEQALENLGFKLFIKDEKIKGNTLVIAYVPQGMTSTKIINELYKNDGIIIGNGQGELKDKVLRIGCIGNITIKDIKKTILALKKILNKN